jgi:hypothetical protein
MTKYLLTDREQIFTQSMELYNHRQIPLMEDNSHPNSLVKQMSSESSDSSISSVLLSMCPLAITDDRYLINSKQRKKKKTNSLQVGSDRDSIRSHSPRLERKLDNDGQSTCESEPSVSTQNNKIKKRISYHRIMDFLNREQEPESSSMDSSMISLQTCLHKLLLQPKILNEIEPKQCPVTPRTSPPPVCIPISPERINQFKQRQIELDRTVEKLLETIRLETNRNIKQISKYWSYIKQISLDKYEPKGNPYQLFDYLLKCTYLNREYELYFEQNDEITAALQVLSTTLSIVHSQHSFTAINRVFDEEEKNMREQLHHQLESLMSSYTDELSFMRERIRFYQSNSNDEKNFDWIQIIQIDYPYLIEKISNDFLIEIPRIEQILLQLLRNTKKHLLTISNLK